jgi:hypothetical protein
MCTCFEKRNIRDYLFLALRSSTCDIGRYIDFEKIEKWQYYWFRIQLQSNIALPGPKYSCPKVPLENDLELGVKKNFI